MLIRLLRRQFGTISVLGVLRLLKAIGLFVIVRTRETRARRGTACGWESLTKGRNPVRLYRWVTHVTGIALVIGGAHAYAAQYSPVEADYPKNVYFGDTHLHTRNSADAYSLGNLNMTPADAFRFAKGEELTAHNGMRVQLRRPLDFLVVSDHSEYLGAIIDST